VFGQNDADHLGPPVGMVTSQSLSLKENGIFGKALAGGRGLVVSGDRHGVVVEPCLPQEVLHGAARQVEAKRQSLAVQLLASVSVPKGIANRLLDGGRHDVPLLRDGGVALSYPAQNLLSGFSAQRHVRQQLRFASRLNLPSCFSCLTAPFPFPTFSRRRLPDVVRCPQ
jgi:hypothetical protein